MAAEESATATCTHIADCDGEHNYECIDSRCICNPLWAHTGPNCDQMRWTSWAVVAVLALVSVVSVAILAPAAKKLSSTSSKCGSGFVELAKIFCQRQKAEDSGSTTIRLVVLSVVFSISSYVWRVLTAIQVISHSTSARWEGRLFLPLTEGTMVLPVATVISVWTDVAKCSMSRSKSKKKMKMTKKVLRLTVAIYLILLLLMSEGGHHDLAMLVKMCAIALGLVACGSGASKLCNKLRASSESSANLADSVFKVSRSMGISLYFMFVGDSMLLSSRTRKSDPANLALAGITVSSLARCFLNKAIFEYMVESARNKNARRAHRMSPNPMILPPLTPVSALRPVVRAVTSVKRLATASRIAADERESNVSRTSVDNSGPLPSTPRKEDTSDME